MIKKVFSLVQGWLKKIFSGSFFFSNILFPLNVLAFYFLSYLMILSRIFHIWQGVSYNPLLDRWSLSGDKDVNYMALATKK